MRTTTRYPECTLIVTNQIDGTYTKTVLPESSDEVLDNCLEVTRAVRHAALIEVLEKYGPMDADSDGEETVAVSVRKTASAIYICWYAIGDLQQARARMLEIQSGRATV